MHGKQLGPWGSGELWIKNALQKNYFVFIQRKETFCAPFSKKLLKVGATFFWENEKNRAVEFFLSLLPTIFGFRVEKIEPTLLSRPLPREHSHDDDVQNSWQNSNKLTSRRDNKDPLPFRFFSNSWDASFSNNIPRLWFSAWNPRIVAYQSFIFATKAFFTFQTQEKFFTAFWSRVLRSFRALTSSSSLQATSSKQYMWISSGKAAAVSKTDWVTGTGGAHYIIPQEGRKGQLLFNFSALLLVSRKNYWFRSYSGRCHSRTEMFLWLNPTTATTFIATASRSSCKMHISIMKAKKMQCLQRMLQLLATTFDKKVFLKGCLTIVAVLWRPFLNASKKVRQRNGRRLGGEF